MVTDLNKLARQIIKSNEYLALATVDDEKGVWICILCYAYDQNFNFYFASIDSSRHSRNISKNKAISFAIYDSRQDWGAGVGLQIEGMVEKVSESSLREVKETYFSRSYPYGQISRDFEKEFRKLLNNKTYQFYKIKPTKVWINNPDAKADERVEVNLGD